jgi:hypothetical protein
MGDLFLAKLGDLTCENPREGAAAAPEGGSRVNFGASVHPGLVGPGGHVSDNGARPYSQASPRLDLW